MSICEDTADALDSCRFNTIFEEIDREFHQLSTNKSIYLELINYIKSPLYVHEHQLYQVLQALLENAFQYTTSGFVRLVVWAEPRKNTQNKNLWILAEDSGSGISEQQQQQILQNFQGTAEEQAEAKALGSGLQKVHNFLDRFQGSLFVASREGVGTVFELYVPDLPCQPGLPTP